MWRAQSPGPYSILTYRKFDEQKPSKKSIQQAATFLFDLSQGMIETYKDDVDYQAELRETMRLKFTNRVVSKTQVGPYEAWSDVHTDTKTGSKRRYLAWGDSSQHWVWEVVYLSSVEELDELMDIFTKNLRVVKISDTDAGGLPLVEQVIPGTPVKIGAPGVFTAYLRPKISSNREGKLGTTAVCRMGSEFELTVLSDDYSEAGEFDSEKTCRSFYSGMKVTDQYEIKAWKILPYSSGGYSGHVFRVDYMDIGRRMYQVSVALSSGNRTVIVHIMVGEGNGGKAKADEILATLKIQ